uniref:Uncharacterized protein n=1 Tax=Opuntia streptacantha TaxID=393608 RepID=A0A7C9DI12_OPUST
MHKKCFTQKHALVYLRLLNASKLFAELGKQQIMSRPHINLKAVLQLTSPTVYKHRWELNDFLWVGVLFFITSCLEVYHHKVLKILEAIFRWVALSKHLERKLGKAMSGKVVPMACRIKAAIKLMCLTMHFLQKVGGKC